MNITKAKQTTDNNYVEYIIGLLLLIVLTAAPLYFCYWCVIAHHPWRLLTALIVVLALGRIWLYYAATGFYLIGWYKLAEITNHAGLFFSKLAFWNNARQKIADHTHLQTSVYYLTHRYDLAALSAEKVLAVEAHKAHASINLSMALLKLGKTAEAEDIGSKALALTKDAYEQSANKDNYELYKMALLNMQDILGTQDKFSEAEKTGKELLSLLDGNKQAPVAQVFSTLISMAWQCINLDNLDKLNQAESYLSRAKSLCPESDQLRMSYVLQNQGNVAMKKNLWPEAEDLYRQALSKRQSVLSSSDSQLADTYIRLAEVCWRSGKPDEAEQYFKKAFAIWDEAPGSANPGSAANAKRIKAAQIFSEFQASANQPP